MLMHNEYVDVNKKFNICYGTPRLKLYESIKGKEFIGESIYAAEANVILSFFVESYKPNLVFIKINVFNKV